jgi:hypothetical protein
MSQRPVGAMRSSVDARTMCSMLRHCRAAGAGWISRQGSARQHGWCMSAAVPRLLARTPPKRERAARWARRLAWRGTAWDRAAEIAGVRLPERAERTIGTTRWVRLRRLRGDGGHDRERTWVPHFR